MSHYIRRWNTLDDLYTELHITNLLIAIDGDDDLVDLRLNILKDIKYFIRYSGVSEDFRS